MTRPLVELAAVVARHGWLESRLFVTLGGWVATVAEPEVRVALSIHARHHGERAEAWAELAPTVPDAVEAAARAIDAPPLGGMLDALAGAEATADRLVGVYRVVVPALLAAYRNHQDTASPVAEAPVVRALRRMVAEVHEELARGEALMAGLGPQAWDVERAASLQARLEALVGGA